MKLLPYITGLLVILLYLCSCQSMFDQHQVKNEKSRVLIVDGFSNHDWQQTTQWVKRILEDSGLFSVDVSTCPSTQASPDWDQWRPEFAEYDVVVQNCNNINNHLTWPREVQMSLEQYVRHGGGLYILHSANNAFPRWEEYNRMIGLGWRDKDFGWAITIDPNGTVVRIPPGQGENTSHGERIDAVLTRLGDHPIHKDFPRQWKAADLEVYRYARGPADNMTVLTYACDPKTQLNFPIEWVVNYGNGKVYNSTFGHVWQGDTNPAGIRCVAFQTSLIRAAEWLATGTSQWPVPDNFPDDKKVQLQKAEPQDD